MKLNFLLFLFGILTIPIYLLGSGGLQISDYFFISSIILTLIKDYKLIANFLSLNKIFVSFLCLVIYTSIVNFVLFIYYADNWKIIFSSLYYPYNFVLMALFYHFYLYERKFIKFLNLTLTLSLLIVFFVAVFRLDYLFFSGNQIEFLQEIGFRRTVTFNNPNQLGYWSLLVISTLIIIFESVKNQTFFSRFFIVGSFIIALYLSIISLSKAAFISVFILGVLYFFKRPGNSILILALAYFLYGYIGQQNNNLISNLEKRINDIGKGSDDNLTGRNYDRVWRYSEYLVFGAGDGYYERFEADNEIHSSYASILFCYGIIGSIFFLYSFYHLFVRKKWNFIIYLIPMLAYGLTHMGLRAKLFWIILIAYFLLIVYPSENSNSKVLNEKI